MIPSRTFNFARSVGLILISASPSFASTDIHFTVPNAEHASTSVAVASPPPQAVPPTQPVIAAPDNAVPLAVTVGDDGRNAYVTFDQPQAEVSVHARNLTQAPIRLTHVAIGFADVYVPVQPTDLKPGGSADLPLQIDLQHTHLPHSTLVCLLGTQGNRQVKGQALVTVTSKALVAFDQRTLLWRVGEPKAAKTVRVVSVPTGLKPKDVWVVGDFKAELRGEVIVVTPVSTDYPANGRLALATEPEDHHPSIVTLVVQPVIPGGPGDPAARTAMGSARSISAAIDR